MGTAQWHKSLSVTATCVTACHTEFEVNQSLAGNHQKFPKPGNILYYGTDEYLSYSNFWIMGLMLFDRLNLVHVQFQSIIHSGIFDKTYEDVGSEKYKLKNNVRMLSNYNDDISKLTTNQFGHRSILHLFYFCCNMWFIFNFGTI